MRSKHKSNNIFVCKLTYYYIILFILSFCPKILEIWLYDSGEKSYFCAFSDKILPNLNNFANVVQLSTLQ